MHLETQVMLDKDGDGRSHPVHMAPDEVDVCDEKEELLFRVCLNLNVCELGLEPSKTKIKKGKNKDRTFASRQDVHADNLRNSKYA